MYITSARAQFKINTHRCWNWHLCMPDGLSVVQCSLGHVIGVAFFMQFQWRDAYVLDNWQLAELPQSGGREFDPHWVHFNLSVYCGFIICISLCQSIKIKPTNMYIASARVQFKIKTQVLKLTPVHSRQVVRCPVQPYIFHYERIPSNSHLFSIFWLKKGWMFNF